MKYSKLTLILSSLLLLAAGVFTACSDFDDMEIPTEELYTREFIKQFGVFDSNHNWNLATEGSITLSPQSYVNEAKVYARYDGKYYYVARAINCYKDVTLNFDVPSGVTDLKIVVDGTTYYAQSGTKILVGGGNSSRSVNTDGECVIHENCGKVTVYLHDGEALLFNAQQLLPVLAKNDENSPYYEWDFYDIAGVPHHGYGGIVPEGYLNINNTSSITQDFIFRRSSDICTIYPLYWNSSNTHTLGLYYFWEVDENGVPVEGGKNKDGRTDEDDLTTYNPNYLHRIPIYKDKCTEDYRQVSIENIKKATCSGTVKYSHQLTTTSTDWDLLKSIVKKTDDVNDVSEIFTFGTRPNPYNSSQSYDYFITGFDETVISKLIQTLQTISEASILHSNSFTNTITYTYEEVDDPWIEGATQANFTITVTYLDGTTPWIAPPSNVKVFDEIDNAGAYYIQDPLGVKSLGIDVVIPDGLTVGMYIDFNGCILYSQAYMNSTIPGYDGKTSYAATFYNPITQSQYFSFEDWTGSSSDADLNDLVFIIRGVTPVTTTTLIEEEKDEPFDWIIAAEDLGTTDDFDFNDMVVGFNVENTNNQYTITFTPLAAGGTMPIYLHFEPIGGDDGTTELSIVDGSDITEDGILYPHYLVTNGGTPSKEDCEWHKWFDNGIHSSSTMINTDNGSTSATTLNQCKVTVDGKFSITHYSNVDNGKFKGFYIEVNGNPGTPTDPKNKNDDNSNWIIGAKSDYATAPQMFVIPDNGPSSGKWLWPAERTHILTAYPDFQGWAEVHTNNTDWHLDTGNKGSGRSSRHGTAAYPTASGGS